MARKKNADVNGEVIDVVDKELPEFKAPKSITVDCLRFKQGEHTLYQFNMDGKLLPYFSVVQHLSRDLETGHLTGFQRAEKSKHIANIRKYIEDTGDRAMIPNCPVMGFLKPPKFTPVGEGSNHGSLTLYSDEKKLAICVDGQQRRAALRDAEVEHFQIGIMGFVAENEHDFNEHYVRVNLSQPLSREELYELIPGMDDVVVNTQLAKKVIPSKLVERMNNDDSSPLVNMIKTPTNTKDTRIISSSAFMSMLEKSLDDGILAQLKNADDFEGMVQVLTAYWNAVKSVFDEFWDLDAKQCRLFHAASVKALGSVMDKVSNLKPKDVLTEEYYNEILSILKPHCAWTAEQETWRLPRNFGGNTKWDAIENTAKGIKKLNALFNTVLSESGALA